MFENTKMIKYTINKSDVLEYKKRVMVRRLFQRALRKGLIKKPDGCAQCHAICQVQGHHVDYGKPLQVVWLCDKCHGLAHRADSLLNPDNNPQTPNPVALDEIKDVVISYTVPVSTFLTIKKKAEDQGMTVSELMRSQAKSLNEYQTEQLQFDFGVNYDQTWDESDSNISVMAAH